MAGEQRTILMVEDEAGLRNAVRLYLEMEGYHVITAASGEESLEKARQELPDVILLDVMLPGVDGFETLKRLRRFSAAPVLMLTAKGDESDVVKGLRLGADDYVRKPFGQAELASRIQAVLRRTSAVAADEETAIEVDDYLTLDFVRHDVYAGGEKVQLRPTEYRLLYHLATNPGRVQTYEQLLSKVWGPEYRDEDNYVRLYVTYLRKKIEPDPAHPRYILTERGLGYRFLDYRRR
ncbi:MAG TPA: response regulator transcription factor [Chloroflexota bacterium]|nr:response regulator transcription factor [Chloroflexota bacterium]